MNFLKFFKKTSTASAIICFMIVAFLLSVMIWLDEPKSSISRYHHVDCAEGLSGFIDLYGRQFCAAKPIR